MFAKIKSKTFLFGFLGGIAFSAAAVTVPQMMNDNDAQATTATLAAQLSSATLAGYAGVKCPVKCDLPKNKELTVYPEKDKAWVKMVDCSEKSQSAGWVAIKWAK